MLPYSAAQLRLTLVSCRPGTRGRLEPLEGEALKDKASHCLRPRSIHLGQPEVRSFYERELAEDHASRSPCSPGPASVRVSRVVGADLQAPLPTPNNPGRLGGVSMRESHGHSPSPRSECSLPPAGPALSHQQHALGECGR